MASYVCVLRLISQHTTYQTKATRLHYVAAASVQGYNFFVRFCRLQEYTSLFTSKIDVWVPIERFLVILTQMIGQVNTQQETNLNAVLDILNFWYKTKCNFLPTCLFTSIHAYIIVLILYISGRTYSFKSAPNDSVFFFFFFLQTLFLAILFYSQSFCQKSAERKSLKKYFL